VLVVMYLRALLPLGSPHRRKGPRANGRAEVVAELEIAVPCSQSSTAPCLVMECTKICWSLLGLLRLLDPPRRAGQTCRKQPSASRSSSQRDHSLCSLLALGPTNPTSTSAPRAMHSEEVM